MLAQTIGAEVYLVDFAIDDRYASADVAATAGLALYRFALPLGLQKARF